MVLDFKTANQAIHSFGILWLSSLTAALSVSSRCITSVASQESHPYPWARPFNIHTFLTKLSPFLPRFKESNLHLILRFRCCHLGSFHQKLLNVRFFCHKKAGLWYSYWQWLRSFENVTLTFFKLPQSVRGWLISLISKNQWDVAGSKVY